MYEKAINDALNSVSMGSGPEESGAQSPFELYYAYEGGRHNFVLFTGETKIKTQAGVWASYIPPRDGQAGVLDMLYATRESRVFMADLIGLVGLHSYDNYGELPVGSHDLSCHSFPVQQRLADLLGQLPADAAINNEDWFSSARNLEYWHAAKESGQMTRLPISDSKQGRTLMMNILNIGREKNLLPDRESALSRFYADRRRANGLLLDQAELKHALQKFEVVRNA
jgi:hypothetical protein